MKAARVADPIRFVFDELLAGRRPSNRAFGRAVQQVLQEPIAASRMSGNLIVIALNRPAAQQWAQANNMAPAKLVLAEKLDDIRGFGPPTEYTVIPGGETRPDLQELLDYLVGAEIPLATDLTKYQRPLARRTEGL